LYQGCSVYQPGLSKDDSTHDNLRFLATFDEHVRFTVYPERFRWADSKEAVFDILIGDRDDQYAAFDFLMTGTFTHIGMACSCHSEFEEFCVIEMGRNVAKYIPYISLASKGAVLAHSN